MKSKKLDLRLLEKPDSKKRSLQTPDNATNNKRRLSGTLGALRSSKPGPKVQQLDIDKLFRTQANTSTKDKDRLKLTFRKSNPYSTTCRTSEELLAQTAKTSTLRSSNTNAVIQFLQQQLQKTASTRPSSARPAMDPRKGKSLDYKRYLNNKRLSLLVSSEKNPKFKEHHSCSPTRRDNRSADRQVPHPGKIKSPAQLSTNNTLGNKFNKDNTTLLRELLNTFKLEDQNRKYLQEKSMNIMLPLKNVKTKPKHRKSNHRKQLQQLLDSQRVIDKVYQRVQSESSLYFRLSSSRQRPEPINRSIAEQSRSSAHILTQCDEYDMRELKSFQKSGPLLRRQDSSSISQEKQKWHYHADVIKRAWRRYQTKSMLERYIEYFQCEGTNTLCQHSESEPGRVSSQLFLPIKHNKDLDSQFSEQYGRDSAIKIQSQEFYKLEHDQRRTVQISNLQVISGEPSQDPANYEKLIKHIKEEEMNKWNEILSIITSSIDKEGKLQADTQLILEKIAEHSQDNLRKLQQECSNPPSLKNSIQVIRSGKKEQSAKQKSGKKQADTLGDFHSLESSSQSSGKRKIWAQDPFQKFNTKQYRQLLDPNNLDRLMRSRERMIAQRYKTERHFIESQYQTDKISVGSYRRRCMKIDEWKQAQEHHMRQSRRTIEAGLTKAKDSIRKTQLDYIAMMRSDQPQRNSSIVRRSYSEQGLRSYMKSNKKIRYDDESSRSRISEKQSSSQYESKQVSYENSVTEGSAYQQILESTNKTIEFLQKAQKSVKEIKPALHIQIRKPNEVPTQSVTDESPPLHKREALSSNQDTLKNDRPIQFEAQEIDSEYAEDFDEYQVQQKQRVLKKDTSTPLHKPHPTVSSDQNDSDLDIEDQQSSWTNNSAVQDQTLQLRIARLISKSDHPQRLGQSLGEELFKEFVHEFLRDICSKDFIVENFKKIVPAQLMLQRQPKKAKGIKTNLAAVKQYMSSLQSYVTANRRDVLTNLQKPTGPSAKELLRYMHINEDEDPPEEVEADQVNVVPGVVFQQHWKHIQPSLVFQILYPADPDRQKTRVEYLKGLTRIHNKAIFQAFNQSLERERNFGQFGEPFPWKHCAIFFRPKQSPEVQKKCLDSAYRKVIGYATTYCGLHFSRQDGYEYSQDYVAQVHDERMTRMLALDILQDEPKWLFYTDQETEALVETAGLVYETLVDELAVQLLGIVRNRTQVC